MIFVADPVEMYRTLSINALDITQDQIAINRIAGHLGATAATRYDVAEAIESCNKVEREKFDAFGALTKVFTVIREFPALTPPMFQRTTEIDTLILDQWVGNHEFDNFPALFGITTYEGDRIRGEINGDPSHPKKLLAISEELGLPVHITHQG